MLVENERRAELLCFLVVTAAASHSLTSEWRGRPRGRELPALAQTKRCKDAVA
ncbi:hypothetical protein SBC2_84730 (plasmid) [Caballeronia sp. SBC2]|nr:hypothetical protein SBC2_84730 [Caballeronia sp. SBC2]